jgi:thiol:disulfide interchange protein DsbA
VGIDRASPRSPNAGADFHPFLARPSSPAAAPAQGTDATRIEFYRATVDQRYADAARYGRQLYEAGNASADEIALIGHFHYLQHDCTQALWWIEKAISTARASGETRNEEALLVKSRCARIAGLTATTTAVPAKLMLSPKWIEGKHYFLIQPPYPTPLPRGKVEVTEVFSYACRACDQFRTYMRKLVRSLPANVVVDYVPASFNSREDWPMFQLAYRTAQTLGVADLAHGDMFDAVWRTGELSTTDFSTGSLKPNMPTIEDAASFYERRAGVPVSKFLSTARSFDLATQVKRDQELIQTYGVDRTPTIVVAGKYRLRVQSAGGPDQLIELVNWLVAKETD